MTDTTTAAIEAVQYPERVKVIFTESGLVRLWTTGDVPDSLAGLPVAEYVNAATLAAELAAARADGKRDAMERAAGWQPIETAPKDGTFVLLWDEPVCPIPTVDRSGFVRTGRFTHPITGGTGWGCVERRHVTNWMPLPAPPSAIGATS